MTIIKTTSRIIPVTAQPIYQPVYELVDGTYVRLCSGQMAQIVSYDAVTKEFQVWVFGPASYMWTVRIEDMLHVIVE